MDVRRALLFAAGTMALAVTAAHEVVGQSNPGLQQGFVPTAGQWNSYFSNKQDYPLPLPQCGALQWTPGVGITCNTALSNSSGVATTVTSTDDNSSNLTYYPMLSGGFGGTFSVFTSSNNLTFNPSTGLWTTNNVQVNGGLGVGAAPGSAQWLEIGAGTNLKAALDFTPGTLMGTTGGGSIEYDGNAMFFSALAGNRGAVDAESTCITSADQGLTNGTNAQAALTQCSAAGQITLAGSTLYEFEAVYAVTNTGTVSHQWATLFGGGATITSINYMANAVTSGSASTPTSANLLWANVASVTPVTTAQNSATENLSIILRGAVRINGAGTFIPQLKLSAAPGGTQTMKANSFFRIWPIGAGTVTAVGNWN